MNVIFIEKGIASNYCNYLQFIMCCWAYNSFFFNRFVLTIIRRSTNINDMEILFFEINTTKYTEFGWCGIRLALIHSHMQSTSWIEITRSLHLKKQHILRFCIIFFSCMRSIIGVAYKLFHLWNLKIPLVLWFPMGDYFKIL